MKGMRVLPFVPAGCLAILLAGCSAADLVNLVTPRAGYSVQQDLAYGLGARQTMDLYTPDRIAAGSPVVVFVYGAIGIPVRRAITSLPARLSPLADTSPPYPITACIRRSVFRISSRTLLRR